jgi:hypothetical protein
VVEWLGAMNWKASDVASFPIILQNSDGGTENIRNPSDRIAGFQSGYEIWTYQI